MQWAEDMPIWAIIIINVIVLALGGAFLFGRALFIHSPTTQTVGDPQLLICSTSHARFFPVRHSFTYPLLYIFFRINKPFTNGFFALDKWRIFHVRSTDYLGSPPCEPSLTAKLRWHLDQHDIPTSGDMAASMLTMPRFFGYSFNPLTTYYIYDPDLIAVVLEVHNTFGEAHIYVVRHSEKAQTISRRFHVSPFNDRLGTYQFKTVSPENGISIELVLLTSERKPKLVATLKSQTASSVNDIKSVLRLCVLCGWWIFLSFPRILYEAWKLYYQKGLPVYLRPEPFHEKGTIGRQTPGSTDLYFKDLVFGYCRHRSESVSFNILPTNTLDPEMIEINPPTKKVVTILSNSFFTNLACHQPLDGLCTTDSYVPDIPQMESYVRSLGWRQYLKYLYMKTMALMSSWIDREVFRRVTKIS